MRGFGEGCSGEESGGGGEVDGLMMGEGCGVGWSGVGSGLEGCVL